MSEENVPLLDLSDQPSDTDIFSDTLENRNICERNVLVPNVIVRDLDENNITDEICVDENIIQDECIDINNVQGILWALKECRPEILERGPNLPEGKEAHIFVSYSSNDKALVFPIIAELEQKHSLACILDERDFQSGHKILENIHNSITISAKVLIFLSDNFNQSGYCKHENDQALIASLENGENMIIPVLLEECDVPRSLRTLTYIDVSKQQTRQKIAMEIYKAFILQDSSDTFPMTRFGNTDQGVVNGFHVDISCCRESKNCHRFGRPAREYIDLNEDVCKEIKSEKIEVSDDLLLNVARLINHHFEEGTCASMHKCGFPLSFCVFMSIICTFMLVSVLAFVIPGFISGQLPTSDEINSKENVDLYSGILYLVLIPVTSLMVAFISCCCQSKIRTNGIARLRVKLFEKITSKSYTNNVLWSLGEHRTRCQNTLFLRILHYNVMACERHVITLLKADKKYKDKEDVGEIAKALVVSQLQTWLTSELVDVNALPDAAETRHNVKGRKKCLCQLLEAKFVNPRGFANMI